MRDYLDTAVRAARAAGKLQRERLWSDFTVDFKGEVNLVTEVDQACEELIVATICSVFPEHAVLAEENHHAPAPAAYRWIIDPLDGTTNYAHGFPWFCVSIALEHDGQIVVGVIYQPVLDELFTATRGEGAFLNGRVLRVSQRQPLINALLATGFPYDRSPGSESNFDQFFGFQLAARGVRRAGAAALDLAYVAAGRLDGFWECQLKPWDVAAGRLLVEEAGGRVSNYRGEPYSVYDHRILASNGLIHDDMLGVLASTAGPAPQARS